MSLRKGVDTSRATVTCSRTRMWFGSSRRVRTLGERGRTSDLLQSLSLCLDHVAGLSKQHSFDG